MYACKSVLGMYVCLCFVVRVCILVRVFMNVGVCVCVLFHCTYVFGCECL